MSLSSLATRPALATATPVDELRTFVSRAFTARLAEDGLLTVSVPAPLAAPEVLLSIVDPVMGVVWDPAEGDAFAGCGVAWRIDLDGPSRFRVLKEEAGRLWPRLRTIAHPESDPPAPRLYGGLAFAVGAAAAEPWRELGDGCFTLPRWSYGRGAERAWLSLTLGADELRQPTGRAAWSERLLAVLEALAQPTEDLDEAPQAVLTRPLRHERLPFAAWSEQVEAIRAAIHSQAFEKIVAARRSVVELAEPLAAVAVLRRLARGLRASTRFAFCRQNSAFLGATPERLIVRRGRVIATEALAGSIGVGDERAEQLLQSGKDLREHQLVVEEIVRRLRPLCSRLEVAPEPQVRELRDVLHLLTPIEGELASPRHVLDLVEELHPTPAVGGVPTAEAVRWITEHEPDPRGWYAAPIGWFDAAGDGELAVALRSCVLQGRRAHLYVGAGVVGDSDPRLEYIETELKEQALLGSLGAWEEPGEG